ncbi:hypothetical protein SLEP1_g37632 [Rubroshorea leprosula]|uniref:Uncharacterized protein n=1 Tax=Rubroshorea leprosula TaxID=152421 RepID=A0AAV5KV94_9ROSI|nr:hypothetical protein SLEP1_g37632 [Rubroshorea leprosula]
MARGSSKVVAVALNKVIQLESDGVAFRLIPESSQVKNAIKLKEKIHTSFLHGTPVFQSKSLILRSGNKSYQPFFFRKRKLEKASRQKHQLNPSFRKHDDNEAGIFVKLLRR